MTTTPPSSAKLDKRKKISLALQGGGSHGAFTWGVLDQLLEDGRFIIDGISGTSAGGMNGACVIQGLMTDGADGARYMLHQYWRNLSTLTQHPETPFSIMTKSFNALNPFLEGTYQHPPFNLTHHPGYALMKRMINSFSPYDLNPFDHNPFEDFIKTYFDVTILRNANPYKLFLAATHVQSGKIKIFKNQDITEKALLASACLPHLFKAIAIDQEHYWDGGMIANPAIFPLIDDCDAKDILVVQITKSTCKTIPQNIQDIDDRFKEITFNSCLVREMRAIHRITKLIDDGIIPKNRLKRINIHLIKNEDVFLHLNASSTLNTHWDFLQYLYHAGKETANQWIKAHFHTIGSDHPINNDIFNYFI